MQNISLALAISSTVPAKDVAHTDTHGVYQGYVKWRTLTDPLTERLKNVGTQYPDLLRDEETIKGILPRQEPYKTSLYRGCPVGHQHPTDAECSHVI